MPVRSAGTLRLVLGDQISDGRLSSLRDLDKSRDTVLLAEVRAETTYVRHHKQKIVLIFSAMRHFADRLRSEGVKVRYVRIDDPSDTHSLTGEITRALDETSHGAVVITEPGEWRLRDAFDAFAEQASVPVEIRDDDRFITSHQVCFAAGRKVGRGCAWRFSYRSGAALLNAVEGFIRQILGWREFMRGVYWLKMPEYKERNVLDAREALPWFYWSGETDMACVRDVVGSTKPMPTLTISSG